MINFVDDNLELDSLESKLVVFPNPSQGEINWFFEMEDAISLIVKISDENGRVVFYKDPNYTSGNIMKIDLNNKPYGFYHFNLLNNKGQIITGKNFILK